MNAEKHVGQGQKIRVGRETRTNYFLTWSNLHAFKPIEASLQMFYISFVDDRNIFNILSSLKTQIGVLREDISTLKKYRLSEVREELLDMGKEAFGRSVFDPIDDGKLYVRHCHKQ